LKLFNPEIKYIKDGFLNVKNTTGSARSKGSIVISGSGTLKGNGSVSGAVTVSEGGAIISFVYKTMVKW